jgi:RNA polymerase sigma-70 factor (ECF subfamily)
MFRVYSRLPESIDPGVFRRYLYRAAYNASLNASRRERNLRRVPPAGQSWGGARVESFSQSNPEERLADGQLLALTQTYLQELPEDRRAALLLYQSDGLSYQEIADVLGRPIGTVRWLIHEARAAIAGRLLAASGGHHET